MVRSSLLAMLNIWDKKRTIFSTNRRDEYLLSSPIGGGGDRRGLRWESIAMEAILRSSSAVVCAAT